jgi:hypothetical protein
MKTHTRTMGCVQPLDGKKGATYVLKQKTYPALCPKRDKRQRHQQHARCTRPGLAPPLPCGSSTPHRSLGCSCQCAARRPRHRRCPALVMIRSQATATHKQQPRASNLKPTNVRTHHGRVEKRQPQPCTTVNPPPHAAARTSSRWRARGRGRTAML